MILSNEISDLMNNLRNEHWLFSIIGFHLQTWRIPTAILEKIRWSEHLPELFQTNLKCWQDKNLNTCDNIFIIVSFSHTSYFLILWFNQVTVERLTQCSWLSPLKKNKLLRPYVYRWKHYLFSFWKVHLYNVGIIAKLITKGRQCYHWYFEIEL